MSSTVSICIPTYNSERFISDALDSAAGQTYPDLEIVVVDNTSRDSTVEICRDYSQKDRRVKVYENEINVGAYGNFNKCIVAATGAYIKFLASDDLLDPTCVEKLVAAYESNPGVTLVGCAQQDVAEDGSIERVVSPYEESGRVDGRSVAKHMLLRMSNDLGAPTSTLMKREDCLEGFKRHYFYFGDMELWCRLLMNGDYFFVQEPLSTLRLHKKTGTTIHFETMLFLADILKFEKDYAGFMREEGVSAEKWRQVIDDRVISYVDYVLLEKELTAEVAEKAAARLKGMVGEDYMLPLLEALTSIVYYGYKRVHELNIDARWQRGQVKNLETEIEKMTRTVVWRMAEPLRSLRDRLAGASDKDQN